MRRSLLIFGLIVSFIVGFTGHRYVLMFQDDIIILLLPIPWAIFWIFYWNQHFRRKNAKA